VSTSTRTVDTRPAGPGPLRKRLRHLPSGLLASAVLLVVGVVVGSLARGAAGAGGAAAGVGLVAFSYTLSSLVIAWADARDPRLVLPVGLFTYVAKFTFLGFVMAAISATDWTGLPAMGVAIMVGALGWTIAQAVWTWRAQIPYVEIEQSR
jgi:ATP synthase protein I